MFEIVTDCADWDALDLAALAAAAERALAVRLDLPDAADITLLATDDARIARLNAAFRGKPVPTNVLSWPSADRVPGTAHAPDAFGDLHLGDLALAFQTCAREAAAQGKPLADHVTHLIVHGTLHLLGYDHETDTDAALMEGIEREVLGKMGLPDPY